VKLLIRACSWLGCHLLLRTVSHFKLLYDSGVAAKVDQNTIWDKDELNGKPTSHEWQHQKVPEVRELD
jgi:hypothetical protein